MDASQELSARAGDFAVKSSGSLMPKKPAKQTSPNASTLMPAPYKPSAEDRKRQIKYEAEDAVRTLTRAEEIKQNPQLMRAVQAHSKEQIKKLQKVCK